MSDRVARAEAIRRAEQKEHHDRLAHASLHHHKSQKDAHAAHEARHAEEQRRIREARVAKEEAARAAERAERERSEAQKQAAIEAEAAAKEAEKQRKIEAEAKLKQRQEERLRGLREAEERSEKLAIRLKANIKLKKEIERAAKEGLLTPAQRAGMLGSIASLSDEKFADLEKTVEDIFDAAHRSAIAKAKVAHERRVSMQAEAARRASIQPTEAPVVHGEGQHDGDVLRQHARDTLDTFSTADRDAVHYKQFLPAEDWPVALKRAATREATLFALQRRVFSVVASGGMPALLRYLESGAEGLPLESMLADVASIYRAQPANNSAVLLLGLLHFCGHSPSFKAVRHLHITPESPNEWIGWLLGTRLFYEYAEWHELKAGGAHKAVDKKSSFELHGIGHAKRVFSQDRAKNIKRDALVRGQQRKGAEAKLLQLFNAYPDYPTSAVGECMKQFDELADGLARQEITLVDLITRIETESADSTKDAGQLADDALAEAERKYSALNAARRDADVAKAECKMLQNELDRLKADATEKRAIFEATKG